MHRTSYQCGELGRQRRVLPPELLNSMEGSSSVPSWALSGLWTSDDEEMGLRTTAIVRPGLRTDEPKVDLFMSENLNGRYTVVKSLGCGKMGRVILCTSKTTSMKFAVKEVTLSNIRNPVEFVKEVGISKRLEHENVIKLKEAFRDKDTFYLVMDHLEGGNLTGTLRESPQGASTLKVKDFVVMMLSAIAYIHHHHVCHRDVKAENFMLKHVNTHIPMQLIDFGLSTCFKKGQLINGQVGTPYTMAPEVVRNTPYSELVDVWSVGCVFFEISVGHAPYTSRHCPQLFDEIQNSPVQFDKKWARHPDWFVPLAKTMLTRDPAHRPQAKRILRESRHLRRAGQAHHSSCCNVS